MFTGARDFNVGRLGIISAGRDVNINVISTPGSPARTLDLQALFSGVLSSEGTSGRLEGDLTSEGPSSGDVLLAQAGKGRRRGFKRALNGVFGKLKGKVSKRDDDKGQPTTPEPRPPSTIAHISTAEVYVRGLLESGNGLPCWDPRPYGPDKNNNSTSPGDVGVYTADRGFERLFNLWDDELGIQTIAESMGGGPYQPPKKTVILRQSTLREGDVVAQGVSTEILQSGSESAYEGFEFNSQRRSAGAILALTSSADLEALEDLAVLRLRECLIQHAGILYLYANRVRRLQPEDSSLYVITGCVKTDAWALGAFRKPLSGTLRLTRSATRHHDEQSVIPVYQWDKPGSIWADLFTGGSPEGKKDHTLFLRGFKIGFSPTFRHRIATSNQSGAPIPGPRGSYANTYHPCDAINTRLLNQTGVDIALSHDDNWRFLFKNASGREDSDYLNLESLTYRGHGNGATHLQISIRNGVAYLESLEFKEEEDSIKDDHRKKELGAILLDQPPAKSTEEGFNVISDSEISLVHPLGAIQFYPIAHGSRSDFYLAVRKVGALQKKVVVKLSRAARSHEIDPRRELDVLRREYTILSLLSHPNVIRLEGLARLDDLPSHSLVLEYKPFGNLPGFVKRSLPFDRMMMAKGIACGLEYIHSKRIVHGGFEPRKVLVELDPETGQFFPSICGFRSSRIMHESAEDLKSTARRQGDTAQEPATSRYPSESQALASEGMANVYVAPIWYSPPEMLRLEEADKVDDRKTYASDVFSCALVIQELLTGRQAYMQPISGALRLSDRLLSPESCPRPDSKTCPMIDKSYNFAWPILGDCRKVKPSERITMAEFYKRLCEGSS